MIYGSCLHLHVYHLIIQSHYLIISSFHHFLPQYHHPMSKLHLQVYHTEHITNLQPVIEYTRILDCSTARISKSSRLSEINVDEVLETGELISNLRHRAREASRVFTFCFPR